MIREIFKMLNQYAVDNPTLPVNQFFPTSSRSWWNAKPFSENAKPQKRAAKHLGHNMVHWETFLWIQMRHLQLKILKNCSNAIRPKSHSIHPQWCKVKGHNKIRIWDASLDRQPKIQSSFVREIFQTITDQTNKECRSQIFVLTNSPRQQHSLVGRYDSRLRYVLGHKFLRMLCCGSKKWRWLIQWMI